MRNWFGPAIALACCVGCGRVVYDGPENGEVTTDTLADDTPAIDTQFDAGLDTPLEGAVDTSTTARARTLQELRVAVIGVWEGTPRWPTGGATPGMPLADRVRLELTADGVCNVTCVAGPELRDGECSAWGPQGRGTYDVARLTAGGEGMGTIHDWQLHRMRLSTDGQKLDFTALAFDIGVDYSFVRISQ